MKKILALILSLMLLVPAFAMAEAATETYTVDLGDFTLELSANDIIQQGAKAENAVMLMIYPNYDETAMFHNNVTAAWTSQDLTELSAMSEEEATAFGNSVLSRSVTGLQAQNIVVTNDTFEGYTVVESINALMLLMSMEADYTGMGVNLKTPLGMIQIYYPMGDKGTYVFSFTADNLDAAAEMTGILDTLVIK